MEHVPEIKNESGEKGSSEGSMTSDQKVDDLGLGTINLSDTTSVLPPALSSDVADAVVQSSAENTKNGAETMQATPAEKVAEEPTPVATGADDKVPEIVDHLSMMTFGNKSKVELEKIQSKTSHLSAGILFTDPSLQIPRPILESLTLEMRFEKPSQIQATTLPLILKGNNLIAQAQSGAGKTIAFVIGILSKVNPHQNALQALCLTPTRELVWQIINDAIKPLSTRLPAVRVEEGLPTNEVARGAVTNAHIVVGTPGTIKKWIINHYLPLQRVSIFVLDEADTMVDQRALGTDTMVVRQKLPPTTQILMFSATYTEEIMRFARKVNPSAYVVTPRSKEELVLDVIFQVKMDVNKCPGGKLQVLKDIYDFMTVQQSIVFVERKVEADRVAAMMRSGGFEVSVLHGDLQGPQRDQVMNEFRHGHTKVLITTNALARGVDVPAVAVVVNYDLPVRRIGAKAEPDESTYLHRIGRCGRFGRRGTAINFLQSAEDFAVLKAIEEFYLGRSVKSMFTDWDPNDIEGLTIAIKELPEGGEILLEAHTGNEQKDGVSGGGSAAAADDNAGVTVSILT